jgi:hypothetical protein
MKNAACALALAFAISSAGPALATYSAHHWPEVDAPEEGSGREVGVTFLATAINLVYFPVRLALTAVTAEVGGILGWINGGDPQSAQALWNVTDGPGVVRPAMLEGRESFRFGPWVSR